MSQFYQYTWPACNANRNEIALQQNVGAGGNVIFNGIYGTLPTVVLPNGATLPPNTAILGGFGRNIYIAIRAAVGNVTFTVIGTQNGTYITDSIIVVPNGNNNGVTVFETITSITANIAAADVTIGIGTTGFMPLILVNTEKSDVGEMSYALSTVYTGPGVTYTIYESLANILFSGQPYAITGITALNTSLFQKGAPIVNTNGITQLTDVCQNIAVLVQSNINSTLQMQFLQI